ncbi:hypothetical protein HYH03_001765 [Edaphochlamys debaryana]|uniref:Uncharacterized protein n=1 Tax=Edaphochlamys debaryana TaxID=47281 RepID=A0A836C5T3_9CHLO|nr:hypothetical protein HYH03_001765 [Edaphochlamys debaryana]|eukprot:KAG2500184.1 hypothetical protein HYH03_001765 [Edaphochlamys debaryana]
MRLGDSADAPTTAKQVADLCLSTYRTGKDSFFGQLVKRRGGQVTEALRLLSPVSATRSAPATATAPASPDKPPFRELGQRPATIRGASPGTDSYYVEACNYLNGELRPGQLAFLLEDVRKRMQGAGLPTDESVAWLRAAPPPAPAPPPPLQQPALPPRARRGSAQPAAAVQPRAAQPGHRRAGSSGSGAYGGGGGGIRCGAGGPQPQAARPSHRRAASSGSGAYGAGGGDSGEGEAGDQPLASSATEQLLQSWLPADWASWAGYARTSIFGGAEASPTQLLAAFRLVHASQSEELKPKDLADLLAQVAYDAARTSLAARGRDLVNNFYQAAPSALTGQPLLLDHEDYVHKTKNLVSQLRNQPATPPGPVLLSRQLLSSTAAKHHTLGHVGGTLAKNTDAQNVPVCEALLYDEELQARLLMEGHAAEALMLRVLGHAHQAWDFPHLTSEVRTRRLENLRFVLWALVGPQLARVDTAAKAASRSHKVLGLTTELCTVMLANIESRSQLLRLLPEAQRALLAERGLSTDDLEGEFALLVNGCGYKPTVEMAMGFLAGCDFLHYVRRCQSELGITLAKSSKAHYSYHEAARRGDASWNDGLYLTAAGAEAYAAHVATVIDRARNALGMKRDRTIRALSYGRAEGKLRASLAHAEIEITTPAQTDAQWQ